MWIPKNEDELRARAEADEIEETEIFDAKADLPSAGKNKELARDIAAMSTDGGVILYGLAEDERERPTILNPIVLAGAAERINNVIQTAIAGTPYVRVISIPSAADPSKGYIAVEVPMSPQAPHQLMIDKDYRFYGRSGPANRVLNQGDIDRLYARRKRWEVDGKQLIQEAIDSMPIPQSPNFAYLILVAQPGGTDDTFLELLAKGERMPRFLANLLDRAQQSLHLERSGYLEIFSSQQTLQHATGWSLHLRGIPQFNERAPEDILDVNMLDDGGVYLFCGRVGLRDDTGMWLFEDYVASLLLTFIGLLQALYQRGMYSGPLDLGIAVTNINGGFSSRYRGVVLGRAATVYNQADYRRTVRIMASQIQGDPYGIARKLVMPLINTLNQGYYDPFPPQEASS